MIALIGCIYGIVAATVFERLTNSAALKLTANRMLAHVLEFSLFIDEPKTIFKAQKALLAENIRALRILSLPALVTSAAFLLLYLPVDRYLARTSAPIGTKLLITQPAGTAPMLPSGAVLDSPPVRIDRTQTWRISVIDAHNRLGHKPWLMTFLFCSTASSAIYAIFRIARETPNNVNP